MSKPPKPKPVKAWGIITQYGRLRNYTCRYRRECGETQWDKPIRVLITPISRKKGKK